MNVRLLVLPLLGLIYQTAGQPPRPEPRYFRYHRTVEVPTASASSASAPTSGASTPSTTTTDTSRQTCAALDTSVFMHSAADLSDIRLFSGAQEIPYALQSGASSARQAPEQPSLLNLGTRAGHVVFDARVTTPSYGIVELSVEKQNFVASVEVSGSQSPNDSGATQLGTYTIFDLTSQGLHRSTVLHLPPSTFPYLHFTVIGPIAPSEIKGLTILEAPPRPPVYTTLVEAQSMTRQGRQSVATFTLSKRVPVDRVEFIFANATGNFSRNVSVRRSDQDRRAPELGTGTVYRIHTTQGGRQIDQDQYTVDVNDMAPTDTGHVQWTVAVDNGDDAPLAIQAVRLQIRERTVCFDANVGASYALYYGDSTLVTPRYDYASLFRPQETARVAKLGAEEQNLQVATRVDTRPFTERHPMLLWGALVVVIGVLGLIAMRTASRVQIS